MEPKNRNKQVLFVAVAVIFTLVLLGSFFVPVLKDLYQLRQQGKSGSYVPLLIFGGFFLVLLIVLVTSVMRGLRSLQNPVGTAPRTTGSAGVNILFLSVFTLFWSGGTLSFDGFMGHGIYKQLVAQEFPSVTGTITHSEVTSQRGSKGGTSYNAVIAYTFTVGDRKLEGAKVRFGIASSSYASAAALVAMHPVGSTVAVYYNPANHEESLLSPGVQGPDFMGLLFMTPFNMVMFGLWVWIGGSLRERLVKPVAGGVKIISEGMVTRIRLPRFSAVVWAVATTGGLGFIAIFLVGFGTKMEPTIPVALAALAAVYGAGLVVYLWQRQKINSGIDDLLINEASRTMELPLTFGRKTRITASVADIVCLAVEPIEHRSSKGGISYTYAPTLRLRGAEACVQKLADWSDQRKAEAFTEWLRARLGAKIPANYAHADEAALGAAPKEISRPKNSKIRVTDGPGGREFYFPAARNWGAACGLTVFFLVWTGFFIVLLRTGAPRLFPIVWGVTDLAVGWGCFNFWCKSSRVTADSTGVRVETRWVLFGRTRVLAAADVADFAIKPGVTSGNQTFSDLQLGLRNGKKITVATSLPSQTEADWLVQEMSRALGR